MHGSLTAETEDFELLPEPLREPAVAEAPARRSPTATPGERKALAILAGAGALLLGVLLLFTIQAVRGYLPVFEMLAP